MERVRAFYNFSGKMVTHLTQKDYELESAIVADHKGTSFILAMGFREISVERRGEPEPEPRLSRAVTLTLLNAHGGERAPNPIVKASHAPLLLHAAGSAECDDDLQPEDPEFRPVLRQHPWRQPLAAAWRVVAGSGLAGGR